MQSRIIEIDNHALNLYLVRNISQYMSILGPLQSKERFIIDILD